MSRAIENWLFIGLLLVVLIFAGRPASFMDREPVDFAFDLAGLVISMLGLLLRVVSRDWKIVHGDGCLVTDGPYSVVRHPMYVGSFLAGLGLCVILGSVPFTIIYSIFFIVIHVRIARREDKYMDGVWPEEHKEYTAKVPGCVPSFAGLIKIITSYRGWISSIPGAFNRERSALCGILVGACISESASDILTFGWAVVHLEVMIWTGVAAVLFATWLLLYFRQKTAKAH
ncbi:isoprenylcysteine carboxylmethyltransferase family protein [bacterium]|nr:isoprenylcysteine carboxylmethyltransferase family protein [bacterium]